MGPRKMKKGIFLPFPNSSRLILEIRPYYMSNDKEKRKFASEHSLAGNGLYYTVTKYGARYAVPGIPARINIIVVCQ